MFVLQLFVTEMCLCCSYLGLKCVCVAVFGSQPPMHLTAPSPVHPSQLKQSGQSLSPNTLQVTPVSLHRPAAVTVACWLCLSVWSTCVVSHMLKMLQ